MKITEVKQRSAYWDNIKGFLIFLVVFAHILFQLQDKYDILNIIVDIIYMFHMPAFVFVSGFFGKSDHSRSFESIIKLIFLYFIFNSVVGFIYGFTSLLEPVYSYWYLIALIIWRLTAHHIAKFKEINFILFFIALLIGFYPSIDNTFAVSRIIGLYPFYMIGYKLSKEKSIELINKKYFKRVTWGLLLALITFIVSFFSYNYFHYTDDALQMGKYSEPIDCLGRIMIYVISFLAICSLRYLSSDKKIPLFTIFGQNSLWIFILHRPFTFIISDLIINISPTYIIFIAIIVSFLLCIIFGNKFVSKFLNIFAEAGSEIFTSDEKKKLNIAKIAIFLVLFTFVVFVVKDAYKDFLFEENKKNEDIIYPIMSVKEKKVFDKAFRITFAGDLILLEDQVKRAYNGKEYDFSDVFEYAKPYISSADFAIGVFEGPMAGEKVGYTSSNFDDDKELYLNFPDSFALAVKNAGFDLVTTANNHILDKGKEGALRTIDVLDKIGLDHTGSYRNAEEKRNEHIKLIECQGIKMAILSYTYGSNNINDNELINGRFSYLTSVISATDSEFFESLKQSVENDFKQAKALSPDLIIVLPHIGTQFSNTPDIDQEIWFDIFKENGADIILGDHPHVVEPAMIEEYDGRNVFTLYCPGNFANIYRNEQGDTSMLTDIYIDRETKKVIGGSIVPLYTHARADGNFRAVPIYDIMNDKELRKQLTTDDVALATNANNIITKVVFGNKMDISSITKRYYFNQNGFVRLKATGLELTENMASGILYTAIKNANSICFIGDSVTEGTVNGGCPWYEPIEEYMTDKKINNYSMGGCTVSYMIERTDEIPKADLYVIALGTNDIRYRDKSICAMTSDEYISEIDELKNKLLSKKSDAKFIFIAPWYSTDGDLYCNLSFDQKTKLNEEYSAKLEEYCKNSSDGFINANIYIKNVLSHSPDSQYLLDYIHPNSSKGVIMYSEAVLSAK